MQSNNIKMIFCGRVVYDTYLACKIIIVSRNDSEYEYYQAIRGIKPVKSMSIG